MVRWVGLPCIDSGPLVELFYFNFILTRGRRSVLTGVLLSCVKSEWDMKKTGKLIVVGENVSIYPLL